MYRSSLLLLSGTVFFCPAALVAQQLEEVTVTARKRVESLQSVPVAVAVIGQEQLRNTIGNDLTKLGELAPQVRLLRFRAPAARHTRLPRTTLRGDSRTAIGC